MPKETLSSDDQEALYDFYRKFRCEEVLETQLFPIIFELMLTLSLEGIDIEGFIHSLYELSNDGERFKFNFNTEIERLLVCKYPRKIVLSTPKDQYILQPQEMIEGSLCLRNVVVYSGQMSKGEEYEEERLQEAKDRIRSTIGNKTIIGTYGQLSFSSAESENLVRNYFSGLFDSLQSGDFTICQSGSRLGVSGLAFQEVKKRNFENIGIVPKSSIHSKDSDKFSLLIVEGDDWGDASFLFGKIPDQIVFAGGGYWSFLEYQKALEANKQVIFLNFPGAHYCREFFDDTNKEFIKLPVNPTDI